jgi:hypothetical protein
MCGGGLRWTYIPTPQPNDCVIAQVCAVCGKRAKKPRVHVTATWTRWLDVRAHPGKGKKAGEIAFVPVTEHSRQRQRERLVHTCCSRPENKREIIGKVIRNQWSKRGNGTIGKFFLIVEDQETGRRHWATLDSCRLVDPITMLAWLAENEGRTES